MFLSNLPTSITIKFSISAITCRILPLESYPTKPSAQAAPGPEHAMPPTLEFRRLPKRRVQPERRNKHGFRA